MEELKKKNKDNKPLNKDEITKRYKDIADWNIAWYLIRSKLIGENNISASTSEVNEKIDLASKNSNLPIDQIKSFYAKHENRHKIEDDIINEKLFDHLKEFVKIKEISKTTDQLRKEKENNG